MSVRAAAPGDRSCSSRSAGADSGFVRHDRVRRTRQSAGCTIDKLVGRESSSRPGTLTVAGGLASWMGACPVNEESAGANYSHRCTKGNRQMRRVLNQAANAAVKAKGTIFAMVYR
jgi:transposase